jgi:hypothetical protein
MDIQTTAKEIMEGLGAATGAEKNAKSPATKVKFDHQVSPADSGRHSNASSEKLDGDTGGMPSEEKGKATFHANVKDKEGIRPDDDVMPGKKPGRFRKQDKKVAIDTEWDTEMHSNMNMGAAAASEIGKTTTLTKEEVEGEEELTLEHHLDALFSGSDLTEDFKEKTATIFKTAVEERVGSIVRKLEEKVQVNLEAAIEENKKEMAENLDSYLNYVVEEWMKENEVAIEKGLRSEITEDFMSGLRNLFLEHNIDVPESKVDVLDKMATRIEELEESLNREIQKNIELIEKVNKGNKRDIVEEIGSDLTVSERVKLRKLLENVEFNSHEDLVRKATILKENYFANPIESVNTDENIEELQTNYLTESNETMSAYLKALSKIKK